MYCRKCGNEIKEGEKVCCKCGTILKLESVNEYNTDSSGGGVSLMGKSRLTIVFSITTLIIGLLYFAPYYVVHLMGDSCALNWFSSIKYANSSDEKMSFYVLAGSALIAIVLLFAGALHTFMSDRVSGMIKAAFIVSILDSIFIILSLRSAISDTQDSFGGFGGVKITLVPYLLLVLSVLGFIGAIKFKTQKNLK